MIQKLKDFTLPIAIAAGLLFHSFFATLSELIPWLIFAMLYFTLCSVDIKKMRVSMLHIWILFFQIAVSLGFYFILKPFSEILAQGALVVILSPTATSAPVIAAMLGANLNTMVTSTLLSNLAVTMVSPLYFSWTGINAGMPFLQSSWMVFLKVAPLILIPLLLALLTQRFLPKLKTQFVRRKNISFYLWAMTLTIVIGRTIDYIFLMDKSKMNILILMTVLSVVICTIQFAFGRWLGKHYGDVVAGGQSIGQKNTVLSIWMAQTYMNPVSSVVPAMYVLWQNLFNSYQIWHKKIKEK